MTLLSQQINNDKRCVVHKKNYETKKEVK